ncbi:DEAD/DEAH box helicase [Carnobacterium maltaromaticum]|uniref:DEAD/DEAH box helicase n=1 Tax=Carnobacterium maltaromaticum TaxID=2751 RepID=UPI0039AF5D62
MNIENVEERFEKYEKDSIVQNLIAQADSRFILYMAREPTENFPNYSYMLDEKCLHIAFSYLEMGWDFFGQDNTGDSSYCFEKAAKILEHLFAYRDCEKKYKAFYCLICSLAYYISSQYSKSYIILRYYMNDSKISELINSFLKRDFTNLEKIISEIEFEQLETNEENDQNEEIIYNKILSKSMILFLEYIEEGNREALINGKNILLDLIEFSEINDDVNLWWIFRLLYLIFGEYETASLWNVLPPVINTNDDKLNEYISVNTYRNPPIVELFKSQRECLETSLSNNESAVIGMPTSSGKTKVAEISIVKTLINFPDALCIFIAPFRSLANEVENSLSKVINTMGYSITKLYGSNQATQQDKKMIEETNVVVATPEKIKSIIRSNPELEEKIKLVIVDEGHLVGEQSRYITSELLIEELKISLDKNSGKLILLSAVLPNLSDFSKWVSGSDSRVSESFWRPSVQRFGQLIFNNNTVNLHWDGDPESFNNNFVDKRVVRPERQAKTGRVYPAVYFPKDKKEAVGATAVKMLSMGSVLVYVGRSNMVESQARVISILLDEQGVSHTWNNIEDLEYVKLTCEEAFGENSEMFGFVMKGIVCHSSKLPKEVRYSIERLMANGNPKIIIATSTLGQGVNIGVSTVIISNVYLDGENLVDVKDFWNISGRAGRAFTDTEGKILFALDGTKDSYSRQKQLSIMRKYFEKKNIEKAKSGVLTLLEKLYEISKECDISYEVFLELLAENRGECENAENFFEEAEGILDSLDDTLISMNLKNDLYYFQDSSKWIEDVFKKSLAYIQSDKFSNLSPENVLDIIGSRNIGVLKVAGPKEKWSSIACSSIPMKASMYIDSYLNDILEELRNYTNSENTFEDFISLIEYLDEFISRVPITFKNDLIEKVNSLPIRDKWFSGSPLCDIRDIDAKAMDVCNEYYGFHFPWIVNAISKKFRLLKELEGAQILEDISLFSEIGLPKMESAKIYIAGIKSREVSIELSSLISFDATTPVLKRLFKLYKQLQNDEIVCTDKAQRWLSILSFQNQNLDINRLRNVRVALKENRVGEYEQLFVREHNNSIYLCTKDYKHRIRIKRELHNKYYELLGIRGLFFRKISPTQWELDSRNPFLEII